ncbi:4-galactosyl-N-acetylglucosaminide 3-alpha-L-fucosyltransferase 9-like isoform X1 [Apostichopus japonicus]|uniref:4-galactosyl-N-acetylglucosaminide 3-alpha-L-fucosyltransferase 9-like isoform X1 n=1 Tax=Stichopus japonicus TaxID=307972 RepID=UPI003AB559F5
MWPKRQLSVDTKITTKIEVHTKIIKSSALSTRTKSFVVVALCSSIIYYLARRSERTERSLSFTDAARRIKYHRIPTVNGTQTFRAPLLPICSKQIQYWGGPTFNLRDGKYYCPDINCSASFTSQRSFSVSKKSHVIILHHLGNWNILDFERARSTGQILAYMTRESPPLSFRSKDLSAFDWTITYRSSSDFPIPYGVLKKSKSTFGPNKNWAEGKTKLAAWFGSNCDRMSWPRTTFVKNLSQFINIDMFGKCGNLVCKDRTCLKKISDYKFYLALENHLCVDYITEKMWRNAFQNDAIPVVYGATKSDYEKVAPKNSFIHVNDFLNMSSLASYLKVLDVNDTLYNSFFEWRNEWDVETTYVPEVITADTLCSMVKKLVNESSSAKDTTAWLKSCVKATLPKPV